MTNFYQLSASELIRKINTKEVLVSEVAESFVSRINEINPQINALNQFNSESVLSNAYKADKKLHSKLNRGKLFGLPISIKDALHVNNFFCSKGSLGLFLHFNC